MGESSYSEIFQIKENFLKLICCFYSSTVYYAFLKSSSVSFLLSSAMQLEREHPS